MSNFNPESRQFALRDSGGIGFWSAVAEHVGTGLDFGTTVFAKTWLAEGRAALAMGVEQANKQITADEFKASPYYRVGMEHHEGMTEMEAAAMAELHDDRIKRDMMLGEYTGEHQMAAALLGMMAGGMVAPENWLPIGRLFKGASIAERAATQASRGVLATIGKRMAVAAGENAAITAAVDPFIFPLLDEQGYDVHTSDILADVGAAAAFGAAFGMPLGAIEARGLKGMHERAKGSMYAEGLRFVRDNLDAIMLGEAELPAAAKQFKAVVDSIPREDGVLLPEQPKREKSVFTTLKEGVARIFPSLSTEGRPAPKVEPVKPDVAELLAPLNKRMEQMDTMLRGINQKLDDLSARSGSMSEHEVAGELHSIYAELDVAERKVRQPMTEMGELPESWGMEGPIGESRAPEAGTKPETRAEGTPGAKEAAPAPEVQEAHDRLRKQAEGIAEAKREIERMNVERAEAHAAREREFRLMASRITSVMDSLRERGLSLVQWSDADGAVHYDVARHDGNGGFKFAEQAERENVSQASNVGQLAVSMKSGALDIERVISDAARFEGAGLNGYHALAGKMIDALRRPDGQFYGSLAIVRTADGTPQIRNLSVDAYSNGWNGDARTMTTHAKMSGYDIVFNPYDARQSGAKMRRGEEALARLAMEGSNVEHFSESGIKKLWDAYSADGKMRRVKVIGEFSKQVVASGDKNTRNIVVEKLTRLFSGTGDMERIRTRVAEAVDTAIAASEHTLFDEAKAYDYPTGQAYYDEVMQKLIDLSYSRDADVEAAGEQLRRTMLESEKAIDPAYVESVDKAVASYVDEKKAEVQREFERRRDALDEEAKYAREGGRTYYVLDPATANRNLSEFANDMYGIVLMRELTPMMTDMRASAEMDVSVAQMFAETPHELDAPEFPVMYNEEIGFKREGAILTDKQLRESAESAHEKSLRINDGTGSGRQNTYAQYNFDPIHASNGDVGSLVSQLESLHEKRARIERQLSDVPINPANRERTINDALGDLDFLRGVDGNTKVSEVPIEYWHKVMFEQLDRLDRKIAYVERELGIGSDPLSNIGGDGMYIQEPTRGELSSGFELEGSNRMMTYEPSAQISDDVARAQANLEAGKSMQESFNISDTLATYLHDMPYDVVSKILYDGEAAKLYDKAAKTMMENC